MLDPNNWSLFRKNAHELLRGRALPESCTREKREKREKRERKKGEREKEKL